MSVYSSGSNDGVACQVFNLGVGEGLSVRQLIREFSRVSGREIPCQLVGRRVGDVDSLICDGSLARQELHWTPTRDVVTMCKYLLFKCLSGVCQSRLSCVFLSSGLSLE